MKVYAYLRVSTEEQDHGVEAQRASILSQVTPDDWFEERASGKDLDGRPILRDLLDLVCDEEAMLVVAKLDRVGRSVVDVLQIFERVHQCGASIKVIDMGIDTSTPAGKMMLTMLAAFAEFERAMISQRTKEGLAAARASGVQLGRPVGYGHAVAEDLLSDPRINLSVQQIAEEAGISVRTVQRIKAAI
jgi:DNA invertase Pin-like site-specific DNA recombinase